MGNLAQAEAVVRMQGYIDVHLEEQITLAALARQAGYSPWHSAKIFKEYTGNTPFEYIRRLRLSKAALLLRDEQRKVVDVAFDFVFDSHEGFSRAFGREFGISPKQYRQDSPPIPLFHPYPADGYYMMQRDTGDLPPLSSRFYVRVVAFPSRKMILKHGVSSDNYFDYGAEVGCDVWGMLASIKEALYEPVGMWLPESLRPAGTSVYAQGVEVPIAYCGEIPEGYDCIALPSCTMLVFQGEPYEEARFGEAIDMLSEIVTHYVPEADGYCWDDEAAPRIQLEPQGYRGYIEARPVRLIGLGKK